jgi:HSP20 family protein
MRQMLGWDPFGARRDAPSFGEFAPTFEMTEGSDAYFVRADLPGVQEEDVEISLTGNRLTVSGHRERVEEESTSRHYASERTFGRFRRTFTLPEAADQEHLHAEMTNGVLTLRISKRPEHQPKQVKIAKRSPGGGHRS